MHFIKDTLKHWSLWLCSVGTAALSFFLLFPDAALTVWNAMPGEVKGLLPQATGIQISLGLLAASIVAKFIKQKIVMDKLRAFGTWFLYLLDESATVTAKKAGLAGVVGVTAAGIIMATLPKVEDIKNDPYRDIVGVWTVCGGETNVAMRHYTTPQCMVMLDASAAEYAGPVLKCVPQLKDKPYQLAASVIMAYNVGAGTFCSSTAAREFKAGHDALACKAIGNFNKGTFPKGVRPPKGASDCVVLKDGRKRCVINGLNNRRNIEIAICEKGL